MNKSFYIDGIEITVREIIASATIVALSFLIGLFVFSSITERQMDINETYNKAIKIEDSTLFQYGMDTNVGNAFVYGDLIAVDPVSYPEIDGKYMYVKKVKEQYTRHTRTVTRHYGKTSRVEVETYYTWDEVDEEDKRSEQLSFCGITFSSNKILIPEPSYIETVDASSDIRYKYYGVRSNYTGTIFTQLKDGTIKNNSQFFTGKDIDQTLHSIEVNNTVSSVAFWLIWTVLTVLGVFAFYCLDNKWLN